MNIGYLAADEVCEPVLQTIGPVGGGVPAGKKSCCAGLLAGESLFDPPPKPGDICAVKSTASATSCN